VLLVLVLLLVMVLNLINDRFMCIYSTWRAHSFITVAHQIPILARNIGTLWQCLWHLYQLTRTPEWRSEGID
jgi:hypothetical protein